MPVESRKNHPYDVERETPLEEIPEEFRKEVPLPGGGTQIIDTRLTYNWQPPINGRKSRLVECDSVLSHAVAEYQKLKKTE